MKFRQLAALCVLGASACLNGCVPAAQIVGSAALSAVWDEIKAHNKASPADDDVPVVATKKPEPVTEVAAAPVQLGSEWHYDDNYGLQVDGVSGNEIRYRRTDDPTQWIVRRGFVREDSQSSTSKRQMMFSDLADKAGIELSSADPLVYRREFRDNGVLHDQVTSWTIEGHRQITVPAGSFDAYVLVTRTRSQGDNWTSFERWYYAPAVGNYVRMEYQYGDTTGSRVLMSYKLLGADGTVVASATPQDPFQSHFVDNAAGHDESSFVAAVAVPVGPKVPVARAANPARNPASAIVAAGNPEKAPNADAMRTLINQLNEVPPSAAPDSVSWPPVPVISPPALPAASLAATEKSVPAAAPAAESTPAPVAMLAVHREAAKRVPITKSLPSDDTRSLNDQQINQLNEVPPSAAPDSVSWPSVPVVPPPALPPAKQAATEKSVPAAAPAVESTPAPVATLAVHREAAKPAPIAKSVRSDDTRSLNDQQINQLNEVSPSAAPDPASSPPAPAVLTSPAHSPARLAAIEKSVPAAAPTAESTLPVATVAVYRGAAKPAPITKSLRSDDTRSLNDQQINQLNEVPPTAASDPVSWPPTPAVLTSPAAPAAESTPAPVATVAVHRETAKLAPITKSLRSDDTRSLNDQQINQIATDFARPM